MWIALVVFTLLVDLSTGQNGNAHSTYLDPDNKYQLFWKFDDTFITFEVQVQTKGYIGIGFSTNGGMRGSDIIIGWVDDGGRVNISDRHATGEQEPEVDDIQNVRVLGGFQNETHTTLSFSRLLDTCDKNDMIIGSQTVRLIWSYSDSDPDPVTGSAKYHGRNRGTRSIYLLNPVRDQPNIPADHITLDLLNSNVSIPTIDTLYWCQSYPVPKLDRKHHVIQLEPIIEPGHESLVHHILVYGCYHMVSNSSMEVGHECYHPNMPSDWWRCDSVLYAWAIGGGTYNLPDHVGLPMGDEEDPTMILMETHYDNPRITKGIYDSSGLRLRMTPTLREFDAGIIQMGAIVSWTQIIPPYAEHFFTEGHCLPECTRQAMNHRPEGIKITGIMLHSHLLGRAIRLRHFRNGKELRTIMRDDNYDFNLQEIRLLEEEVTVLPGDTTITECDYDSSKKMDPTFGGLETTSEMCLAFTIYYPRINLTLCSSGPSQSYLASFRDMSDFRSLYHMLTAQNWTDENVRDDFQRHVSQTGVPVFESRCSKGSMRYMNEDERFSLPPIVSTWKPRPDCSSSGAPEKSILNCLAIAGLFMLLWCLLAFRRS